MAQTGYASPGIQPQKHHSKSIDTRRVVIAKNQNTFAKRQREMEKRARADAKRAKKQERKLNGPDDDSQPVADPGYGFPDEEDSDDA